MPKGTKKQHVLEVDPVVVKVQETLEENLTYFIDNIAGLVRRYDGLLGRALQLNKGTASEIAQLQTYINEAASASANDDDSANPASSANKTSDDAAPSTAASTAEEKKKDESSTTTTAPLIKQVSNALPTSPLLKRAASPLSGDGKPVASADSFPSIDKDAKKVDQDGATTKDSGDKAAASKKSTRKVRIIEVKFPDNTEIVKQLRQLKRESYELGATMDGIHDWIALNVPDMKDDENDGVEVMGAVIEQVTSLTDTVRSVYAAESKYLEERAELEKSMLKLPESETMKLAIKSHDADTWDEVDRGWRTLIRVCLLLYSILSKNMAMLKEPRKKSTTSSAMFM